MLFSRVRTTSFLTATTLIYATGAGITAAAMDSYMAWDPAEYHLFATVHGIEFV